MKFIVAIYLVAYAIGLSANVAFASTTDSTADSKPSAEVEVKFAIVSDGGEFHQPVKSVVRNFLPHVWDSCKKCPSGATGMYASSNCIGFRNCVSGADLGIISCPAGLLFDETISACNWPNQVICNCVTEAGSASPSKAPVPSTPPTAKSSYAPTARPIKSNPPPTTVPVPLPSSTRPSTAPVTGSPSASSSGARVTGRPSATPSKAPVAASSSKAPATESPTITNSAGAAVEAVLEANKVGIDNNILRYQTPSYQWIPSTVYRYQGLIDGLRVMYLDGVGDKYFFMGDTSANGIKYGLVNVAAFLAQSMKETIHYNACDENSWDLINGKYPLSNACGQLGQSYQDYKCSEAESYMACPVDPKMEIKATTNAKWWGAPGPLFCGPKTKYPFTGYWDYQYECNNPWANPPKYCTDYEGQNAGRYDNSIAVANQLGRTDVEGCCFWGRGVIQTTGVCNFGKLNYYIGKRAADEGRKSLYPNINFCEQPNAICDSEEHKELKWIAGMFYWVESLQTYHVGGWDYITELKKFVDGGMQGTSFIDSVSGIVNRGCHNPPCQGGAPLDGGKDRADYFQRVLNELQLRA